MGKKRSRASKEGEKQEETPDKCPKQPGAVGEAGSLVGRAVLSTLDTASLSRLLAVKKIPGRSKITKKASKVDALEGLVTADDMALIGTKMNASTGNAGTPEAPRAIHFDLARRLVKGSSGS
jgi:hypothetical protein